MHPTAHDALTRPATLADAELIHEIYLQTPKYFDVISIPVPTPAEVRRELEAAALDPRRRIELLLAEHGELGADLLDPVSGRPAVGYLDYKLDYPETGDATVNLILIIEGLQSHGYGSRGVSDLETRLRGSAKRVLASIYGQNPRAQKFWKGLGYQFAIDAKPVLDWYAKAL